MKKGDHIRLRMENYNDPEEIESRTNYYKIDPRLIRGKIISLHGENSLPDRLILFLVELEDGILIEGEKIVSFYKSEIELDLQTKRNNTLNLLDI